jgi:hypothetical protein
MAAGIHDINFVIILFCTGGVPADSGGGNGKPDPIAAFINEHMAAVQMVLYCVVDSYSWHYDTNASTTLF